MRSAFLGLGENVADFYIRDGIFYPGGNALNYAVYAGRLGAEAAYLGAFAEDEPGRYMRDVAEKEGLCLERCRFLPGKSGATFVEMKGEERIFLRNNKGEAGRVEGFSLTSEDLAYIAGFDIVATSIYSGMDMWMPQIGKAAPFVAMDFSWNFTDSYLKEFCPHIQAAQLSVSDLSDEETEELMRRVASYGPLEVVLATRGTKSVLALIYGELFEQPVERVRAVDTLGAGDAFFSCFLLEYQKVVPGQSRKKMQAALSRAAGFAALVCLEQGAFGYGRPYSEETARQMGLEQVPKGTR